MNPIQQRSARMDNEWMDANEVERMSHKSTDATIQHRKIHPKCTQTLLATSSKLTALHVIYHYRP
jgi:hypothetical protein